MMLFNLHFTGEDEFLDLKSKKQDSKLRVAELRQVWNSIDLLLEQCCETLIKWEEIVGRLEI
jgi:hypothetical protein